jgi:hypothetical protein
MRKKEEAEEKRKEKEERFFYYCPLIWPLDLFLKSFNKGKKRHPDFFEHLNNARIEFLLGLKSLVEDRISEVEKTKKRKVTKIEVEA